MSCIKLKKLEEYLQCVDGFIKPNILLEQYQTPSHVASHMLYTIQSNYKDLENKFVADLGSGTGILSIGAFLLGAKLTIGFEVDGEAIEIFKDNLREMEIPQVDCIQMNVLNDLTNNKWKHTFDTVIMNPPFGTKHNAGMDMKFLQIGLHLANTTVYSLHKTSTREYIKKKTHEWGIEAKVIAELRYNLDSSYKFHKKTSVDIEVDCWRFDVTKQIN